MRRISDVTSLSEPGVESCGKRPVLTVKGGAVGLALAAGAASRVDADEANKKGDGGALGFGVLGILLELARVPLAPFVVGLVLKRPGIIQAGIEKVFRKDK